MTNINDTYFDGYYKEIWRTIIPQVLTDKEVDFMVPYFNLTGESRVLDLMCGYGRHAIALARRGIKVTAVDNLEEYVEEIIKARDEEQLPIQTITQHVGDFKDENEYDLVICMGNSLNFFNTAETITILSSIYNQLKPGGSLLINSWSISEMIFKQFREKSWSNVGDLKLLTDSKIIFHPTRMETESTIIAPDGTTEVKMAVDYIYSMNEMEAMIKQAGLILKEVYSIPGKKQFSIGEPRAYFIAVKE